MENQISQSSSLPVSPIPNGNGINASSLPTPGFEFNTVLEKLLNKHVENAFIALENARLREELEKKNDFIKQSEAASNAEISKLTKMVQDLQAEKQLSSNRVNHVADKNAKFIQSRMCTVDDVLVDEKIDYERLKYKLLMVKRLVNRCGNWEADRFEVSPDYYDLQICVKHEFVAAYVNLGMPSRILCSDIMILKLNFTTLKYSEYKKLISSPNLLFCQIMESNIINESGNPIEVANIIKEVLNVKFIDYYFKNNEITSETAQKLSQLRFSRLEQFNLYNIKEPFDLNAFAEFIKQHPTASNFLQFKCSSEFFAKIKSVEEELHPTLPSTCKLKIERKI